MDARRQTILVLNSGSSSVKYELFEMAPPRSLLQGQVEGVGGAGAVVRQELRDSGESTEHAVDAPDHDTAMGLVFEALAEAGMSGAQCELMAVGHRVVHGGEDFVMPTLLDEAVIERIREFGRLAPLHSEANIAGIAAARAVCPDVPHVAVFDTAFHLTMPECAREYALPRSLVREHSIRRYGFHGISHAYVAREAARLLGRSPGDVNLITLHLGNGASACAISGGESIDTSMGLTPLEGLVMGTRCGDVDPAVPLLVAERTGASRDDMDRMLNEESGLLGLCGTRDMREIHELAGGGDPNARLAIELFCYRAKKYLGAYLAVLGQVDAVVFTAGIGENDADVRGRICEGLEGLGVVIDGERNTAPVSGPRPISPEDSRVAVLVVPTDEESEIARLAYDCVTKE